MIKLFSFVTALLCISIAAAQLPSPYSFTHYSTGTGLLSNQVNTVVQDGDGFIWTGTTDGLQRYDGTRYKTFAYKDNDPAGIPAHPVWQLLVDSKQHLWLLFADGTVGIFDTHRFIFTPIPAHFSKPVTPNTFLKRLITDERGHIFYLLSGSEIITLNDQQTEFAAANNFFAQEAGWNVIDFIQQPGTQKYWMSIQDAGMAVYNAQTKQLSYYDNNKSHEPLIDLYAPASNHNKLFFDKQQRLWSITREESPEIWCFDLAKQQAVLEHLSLADQLKTRYNIKAFVQQRDGSIWINGLLVFAKYLETSKQFQLLYNGYLNDQSISYEMLHCLFEDREQNIWVATDNNGLYRFNPSKTFFTSIKHLSPATQLPGKGGVTSFTFTRGGHIVTATLGDGLFEYDKNGNPVPLSLHEINNTISRNVWCMQAAADSNTIWMAADQGICNINQANGAVICQHPSLLQNASVRQMAEDKSGNWWLGTASNGVFKWNAHNGNARFDNSISAINAIPAVQVNKITVDANGMIWVGTPENGIYVVDPLVNKLLLRFTDTSAIERKLPERGISSILDYNDSLLIITTATRLVVYNRMRKQLSVLGAAGSISGFITAMERDGSGFLWITSTNGLYRVDIKKQIFQKFSRADGIDNEHFLQSASRVLPDGRMLFGNTTGALLFDPLKINTGTPAPDVRVTGIKIMGRQVLADSLLQQKNIELQYQDNAISFEFSALVYNNRCQVEYQLEGLDKSWRAADNNNEAVYSYIPDGSYTFMLRAAGEVGSAAHITALHLRVHPPFWKSWWFYSALALITGVLLFWLDKERMKRRLSMQHMRSDIAENLYHDVHTALGNINVLSEIAKLKADKDLEKSKDYIQQINSKSQQMMVAMDDMLWGMHPENDSMQKTIDRLREHINLLCKDNNADISLQVDPHVETLKLDMKSRQHIFWFYKTGITNIIKTGAVKCHIHISLEKTQLVYSVEFNNSTVDMQQLNNLMQRQELEKKLNEIKAHISKKLQQNGCIIRLTIPVPHS